MQTQRNEQGQFLAGNSGGPGRPRRQAEIDYLRSVMEACPPEKWQEIVKRAVDDATAGDDKARSWLASYLIGKPAGAAPTVTAVVVAQILGIDPALERAISHAREKQELNLF